MFPVSYRDLELMLQDRGCKRRSKNPSLTRPGGPAAPE
jgi:hypothetical protein